jgi:hypothetical protein
MTGRELVLRLASLLCRAISARSSTGLTCTWRGVGVELAWTVGRACNSAIYPPLSLCAVDPTQNSSKESVFMNCRLVL